MNFVQSHWGDLVGLLLIAFGAILVVAVGSPVAQDTGKGLIGAGLIALRPKSVPANGGSNDSTTPPKP